MDQPPPKFFRRFGGGPVAKDRPVAFRREGSCRANSCRTRDGSLSTVCEAVRVNVSELMKQPLALLAVFVLFQTEVERHNIPATPIKGGAFATFDGCKSFALAWARMLQLGEGKQVLETGDGYLVRADSEPLSCGVHDRSRGSAAHAVAVCGSGKVWAPQSVPRGRQAWTTDTATGIRPSEIRLAVLPPKRGRGEWTDEQLLT